ncbi:MAG: hypothetical protein QM647_15585 [Asticcacaulis sp.]|uniref:hypothetical protein n=1 Tax=Asticcacaulis sp. TaxID=1872648 RepID=UPI0039E693CE
MAYRDSDRNRNDYSPFILWPQIVLIVIIMFFAYCLLDGRKGVPHWGRYEAHPADYTQEYQPTVGPDPYATK